MSENTALWDMLKRHRGHQVTIASYGDYNNPQCICLECEDCNEIVVDAEMYTLQVRSDVEN